MIAVDSNILIYAHRTDSPFHGKASRRLSELAASGAPWAIPWPCMHEFLSIITNRHIYRPQTPLETAIEFGDAICAAPELLLLAETERHWGELKAMALTGRATGGLVHDARIAAICLQHGVRALWSSDRDFSRFPTLRVVNPLVA